MRDEQVSWQVMVLRRELEQIGDHNRAYFSRKSHGEEEKRKHLELLERVVEIRAELSDLMMREAG